MGAETQSGTGVQSAATAVRIGVTGHRCLPRARYLRWRVRQVLRRLDQAHRRVPYTLVIVSPLAEGADRLVAKEVLAWTGTRQVGPATLEVLLPLPEDSYLNDFQTSQSKEDFWKLRALARTVQAIDLPMPRPAAYEAVGRSVVDGCDVLIALWDGKPSRGQGGTAEIVDYARRAGRRLFWIHTRTGRIRQEGHDGASRYLEEHDREKLGAEAERAVEAEDASLSRQADEAA